MNNTSPENLNKQELISIIMSVYNCEDTLRESIDSIIAQTYQKWEFIICNDASTDRTQAILEEYASRYPDRFVLIENKENKKLAFSLNRCLERAKGTYVARMDGDDISTPDRLEKEIAFLQNHLNIDLVGCEMQRFSAESGLADIVTQPEYVDKYSMRNGPPFCHATILTYKRVYDTLEGYTVEERTNRAQDYDLWFRFFAAGFSGYNLQEPLYLVREDMNAIKRRTFKVRWNAFKTTRFGYKLLGFPKSWLIREFFTMIGKSLVPYRLIYLYRKIQARRHREVAH